MTSTVLILILAAIIIVTFFLRHGVYDLSVAVHKRPGVIEFAPDELEEHLKETIHSMSFGLVKNYRTGQWIARTIHITRMMAITISFIMFVDSSNNNYLTFICSVVFLLMLFTISFSTIHREWKIKAFKTFREKLKSTIDEVISLKERKNYNVSEKTLLAELHATMNEVAHQQFYKYELMHSIGNGLEYGLMVFYVSILLLYI